MTVLGDRDRVLEMRGQRPVLGDHGPAVGGWETSLLPDGWTVVTEDGSLSAHFEHTIAVTEDGHEVLTARG